MKCFELVFSPLALSQIFSLDSFGLALTDFIKVIEFCDSFLELLDRLLELHILVGKTLSLGLGTLESPL